MSGIYFAKFVRLQVDGSDDTKANHAFFVVREPDGGPTHSAIVVKTADATWQAYNPYPPDGDYKWPSTPGDQMSGHFFSLYTYLPDRLADPTADNPGDHLNHAFAVSYNRPLDTRRPRPDGVYQAGVNNNQPFALEGPLVHFLEANGYDVSYLADTDFASGNDNPLLTHHVAVSVGHDEYWSASERADFEDARDRGVNLTFLSANEAYWNPSGRCGMGRGPLPRHRCWVRAPPAPRTWCRARRSFPRFSTRLRGPAWLIIAIGFVPAPRLPPPEK